MSCKTRYFKHKCRSNAKGSMSKGGTILIMKTLKIKRNQLRYIRKNSFRVLFHLCKLAQTTVHKHSIATIKYNRNYMIVNQRNKVGH